MDYLSHCTIGDGSMYDAQDPAPPPAAPAPQTLRLIIERTVADVFDIDCAHLRLPTRGQYRVALARQVAMYTAHVGCGISLTEVGELFNRDRTTVSHACTVVERRRDNVDFNHAIDLVELVVRVLTGPRQRNPYRSTA